MISNTREKVAKASREGFGRRLLSSERWPLRFRRGCHLSSLKGDAREAMQIFGPQRDGRGQSPE